MASLGRGIPFLDEAILEPSNSLIQERNSYLLNTTISLKNEKLVMKARFFQGVIVIIFIQWDKQLLTFVQHVIGVAEDS